LSCTGRFKANTAELKKVVCRLGLDPTALNRVVEYGGLWVTGPHRKVRYAGNAHSMRIGSKKGTTKKKRGVNLEFARLKITGEIVRKESGKGKRWCRL